MSCVHVNVGERPRSLWLHILIYIPVAVWGTAVGLRHKTKALLDVAACYCPHDLSVASFGRDTGVYLQSLESTPAVNRMLPHICVDTASANNDDGQLHHFRPLPWPGIPSWVAASLQTTALAKERCF
jgi:hypothetical protein